LVCAIKDKFRVLNLAEYFDDGGISRSLNYGFCQDGMAAAG